ncbi:MAG: acyl-CoA-binding protein [Bacteroidetes bacterium]|nr:MAG: acyl-CoA-binding protein [Bacteroidota bacterium]
MELMEQFEAAVAQSKLLTTKPDNETLLKLYSLYKQSTEGDAPADGPTNPFDFVAKAKHAAWADLAGKTKTEAMNAYVATIQLLK